MRDQLMHENFVGRAREIELFLDWLHNPEAPQTVFSDWSPTAFKQAINEHLDSADTVSADIVDTHVMIEVANALVADFADLEQRLIEKNTCLLVIIDTFEVIEENPVTAVIDPRHTFPENYGFAHMHVMLAGRNKLDWANSNWREAEVQTVALPAFTLAEMFQYVYAYLAYEQHFLPAQTASLYNLTEGRPILLGLVVDVLNHRILSLEELVAIPEADFEHYLVVQVNKLENPLNWVVLFMAHVYHHFNFAILAWLLDKGHFEDLVPDIQSQELVNNLPLLSFVRQPISSSDFMLHDEMRHLSRAMQNLLLIV